MIYSDIVDLLSSAVATIENKNIIIKGHTNSNKYYILILNDKYEILYSGYFDSIEEQQNFMLKFFFFVMLYVTICLEHHSGFDLHAAEHVECVSRSDDLAPKQKKQRL